MAWSEPSPWVRQHLPVAEPGQRLLDVAAGSGRHARFAAALGYDVLAVDRDIAALAAVPEPRIQCCTADLETQPWPLPGERFAVVLVTHYLHRPLMKTLFATIADGGRLIYETFAVGNEQFGRPTRPEFLLQPYELLQCVDAGLHVLAFEQRVIDRPGGGHALIQRVVATRTRAA